MGRTPVAAVPDQAVPIFVEPVLDIQRRARFWARLSTIAMVLVAVASMFVAWSGRIPWWAAIALLVVAYFPLAAETRIVELREKLNLQLVDQEIARNKKA